MGARADQFTPVKATTFTAESWGSGSTFGARVRRTPAGEKLANGVVVDSREPFETRSKARNWAEQRAKELAAAEGATS